MVYLFALAWCLRNYPGIVPWWADHHRRKVWTNVSQTSTTQGILSFRWELQGTWQMWPSSPYPVQFFYECSTELSHNTTLGWTPGALSPGGVLRRDEWAEHGISPANHLGITELCLSCISHAMEQADEEDDVTPTGILWGYDLAPHLF